MNKWIIANRWEIVSNVIAVVSLCISVWLALSANKIAQKANELSNHAAILKISNLNISIPSTDRQMTVVTSVELSNATIRLSGTIQFVYGTIRHMFIAKSNWEEQIEVNKVNMNHDKNNVTFDELIFLSAKGKHTYLNDHFYLLIVDETGKLHRFLYEVTSTTVTYSTPNTDGLTGNIGLDSRAYKKPETWYRYFDDSELLAYQQWSSEKEWLFLDNQPTENIYYEGINYKKVENEIKAINEMFTMYGFNG